MGGRWRSLLISGAILLALVVGLAGGVALDRLALATLAPPGGVPVDARSEFRLMGEAWDTIQRVYVDREALQPQRLTYGAIAGMVDALGDIGHSRFLSPDMRQMEHDFARGQFEGIGAEVQMKDNRVVIVAPLNGSPALEAGLAPGDVILQVDGESIAGLSLIEVVDRILGPAGTSVQLTIMDPGSGRTRDITIVRAQIQVENVTWAPLPGTGVAHVRISAFSDDAAGSLNEVLGEIQREELSALVLDLRSNPGGLLKEAVGTASQFLEGGDVLQVKDAQGRIERVPVERGGEVVDLPVVVLVNGGSASASEIVAGALQDAGRAKLVGETTFGTGTVLTEFPLPDGSALLLAIQEWLTPKGRVIWHEGLAPDVVVALPSGVDPLIPLAERDLTLEQIRESGDAQLLRALDLLGQPSGVPSP